MGRTTARLPKKQASPRTIYTYFPSKEAIFTTLAQRYRSHLTEWHKKIIGRLKDPLSAAGLRAVASAIRTEMYEQAEYFLMLLMPSVLQAEKFGTA